MAPKRGVHPIDPFLKRKRAALWKKGIREAPEANRAQLERQAAKRAIREAGPKAPGRAVEGHAVNLIKQRKRILNRIKKRGGKVQRAATQRKNRYPDKNSKAVPVYGHNRRPPDKVRRDVIRGDGKRR